MTDKQYLLSLLTVAKEDSKRKEDIFFKSKLNGNDINDTEFFINEINWKLSVSQVNCLLNEIEIIENYENAKHMKYKL